MSDRKDDDKNQSGDASPPPTTVPEGDNAAIHANQVVGNKKKMSAVLTEFERTASYEMGAAYSNISDLN